MSWLNFGWYGIAWYEWLGNALILLGVLAVLLGMFGVLRFSRFTMKVLAATKIDTVAIIAILLGVAVKGGFSWLSAKALLILFIVFLTSPIASSQMLSRALDDGED